MMEPLDVARYAIRKLGRKVIIIPGWQNRFSAFVLTRLLPRKVAGYFVARNMAGLYNNVWAGL
jgi:hypothetical protein